MKGVRTAKDLMSEEFAEWVTPGDEIRKVARLMWERKYSQVPVREGDKNHGRITDRLILRELKAATGAEIGTKKVRDVKGMGEPFKDIKMDATEATIEGMLEEDEAVLVRASDRPQEWRIITRADLLKRFIK